jgi:uncharacterized protein YkwD
LLILIKDVPVTGRTTECGLMIPFTPKSRIMSRSSNRCALGLLGLMLVHANLMAGPTTGSREQSMLELINRLRENPQVELQRMLGANDPDINASLKFYNVNLVKLKSEFAALKPVPPLAWNETLAATALAHTRLLRQHEEYLTNPFPGNGTSIHQLPNEPGLDARLTKAGYFSAAHGWDGENIPFAWKTLLTAHANLAIDWGPGPDGMQPGRGHRANLTTPTFSGNGGPFHEIGIGIVDETQGTYAGKMLITQDFGLRADQGLAYLLGTVYRDADHNGLYSMGEGLGGVTLTITGSSGTFTTKTASPGGYQVQLPAGTYSVTARGGGLKAPLVVANVVVTKVNKHVNLVAP